MYSVILAAVLTTGGSTAQWHGHGCHGNSWGWGSFNYCSGCFGCAGYGCYGCYGGAGCYGSWGYYGGYGNYAHPAAYAMYGTYWYCTGGYGYAPAIACYGGLGCYGGWSGYGPALPGTVVNPSPATTPTRPQTQPKMKFEDAPVPKAPEKMPEEVRNSQPRGTVVVEVPADAKVYIDGKLMRSTSTPRVFHTPPLQADETYFYDIRADVVRDGKTVSQSQRVIINPGQRVLTAFKDLDNRDTATAQNAEE